MLYNKRLNKELSLQGYDLFNANYQLNVSFGGVQDNYILGNGDEIIIILQGVENKTYRKKISNQGILVIDFLGPITASGRTFLEVENEIKARVKTCYLKFRYVSLGKLKRDNNNYW